MAADEGPIAEMASGGRAKRPPRRITPDYLRRAALHYLERYAAPAAQLRRVLARKVAASCRHHGEEASHYDEMLDDVVARCVASGLVDDRRFAEGRAASLRRRGSSSRQVSAKLAAKGVERGLAQELAQTEDEEELAAARITARRKRLGPWRRAGQEPDRARDLAVLGRAGFSFAVARAVLDETDAEDTA